MIYLYNFLNCLLFRRFLNVVVDDVLTFRSTITISAFRFSFLFSFVSLRNFFGIEPINLFYKLFGRRFGVSFFSLVRRGFRYCKKKSPRKEEKIVPSYVINVCKRTKFYINFYTKTSFPTRSFVVRSSFFFFRL